ncbi:hypothetical protein AAFP35_11380 [Gordonia sp. CPCC 206044]
MAALGIPWALAAYYMGSDTQTITQDAQLVANFHTGAATAAAVLLLSTVLLRFSGRSLAATVPFAITWAIALAYSVSQVREYGGHYRCDVELCMPDFELFLTAVPFAIAVSTAVVASAVVNRVARDSEL